MTGLPITLTFTFDDMAQAEAFLADVHRSKEPQAKADIREQRENVPSQHEVRPGSARLGIEQQCDTLGVTAGETAPHSEMDGGAIAAVKGQARPASVVDAEPSSSFALNPFIAIRPNCQKPDHCSGYGRNHCHTCKVKAGAEAEAA